jgi:hypothetical protein
LTWKAYLGRDLNANPLLSFQALQKLGQIGKETMLAKIGVMR